MYMRGVFLHVHKDRRVGAKLALICRNTAPPGELSWRPLDRESSSASSVRSEPTEASSSCNYSIDQTRGPQVALMAFFVYYVLCMAVTWYFYSRRNAQMPC